MLTLFTIPKPFKGHIGIIQRNAIQSWKNLSPDCEIILFGNEEGTAEIARELNVRHIPEIKRNDFGTPLVNDVFEKAQETSKNHVLAYVNADIILMKDFLEVLKKIDFDRFLIVGKRHDLDVKEEINFKDSDWEGKLKKRVSQKGNLHGPAGIDYFIFPKGVFGKIPPFAVGRIAWDNWFLYRAWVSDAPVIDATEVVGIVHQDHHYSHPKGKRGIWKGEEAKRNLRLANGGRQMLTIRDATLVLTPSGLQKPKMTFYRFFSSPFRYFEKTKYLKPILFSGWLVMILWRKLRRALD
jgi:hypothetical protein